MADVAQKKGAMRTRKVRTVGTMEPSTATQQFPCRWKSARYLVPVDGTSAPQVLEPNTPTQARTQAATAHATPPHLRRRVGVLRREVEVEEEAAPAVRRVLGAHHDGLPQLYRRLVNLVRRDKEMTT